MSMKKHKKQPSKKSQPVSNANVSYEQLAHYFNLGSLCLAQGKLNEAQKNYLTVLTLKPDFAEAHNNLGVVLQQQGRINLAIERYQRALALKSDYAEAHQNLGMAFKALKNFELAISHYQQALALNPNYVETHDDLFRLQLTCCDWSDYANGVKKIRQFVNENKRGVGCSEFLSISASAAEQLQCARTFVANNIPQPKNLAWTGGRYQHNKIRIAYISADFRAHPVTFLMTGLFEQHDRQRFEIIAISLQPAHDNEIGQRVKAAFDRFIDVTSHSNDEIAQLIRNLEIDIAVDLMGFTNKSRYAVFGLRPAPIQVNYLGYPGTIGADYMDYIIADRYIIPPALQNCYAEKVAYLPETFQANDDKRTINPHRPTRQEVGLPESGFVFCSFNNSYKLSPTFFDIWMRLLAKVEGSVLWILEAEPVSLTSSHLKKEATRRGISADRLIFAPRIPVDQHLARYSLADLFLDTLPCNAGTTASDALWVDVPVLTCSGEAMASRMAGSLLTTLGLTELIADNLAEYEALAMKLATNPALFAELRAKLVENKATSSLFNTARFCKHIEAAYHTMWEKHQRGELPSSFSVPVLE